MKKDSIKSSKDYFLVPAGFEIKSSELCKPPVILIIIKLNMTMMIELVFGKFFFYLP